MSLCYIFTLDVYFKNSNKFDRLTEIEFSLKKLVEAVKELNESFVQKHMASSVPTTVKPTTRRSSSYHSHRRKFPSTAKKRGTTHDIESSELNLTPQEIIEVKEQIREINNMEEIKNVAIYGPPVNNTTVIVLQVRSICDSQQSKFICKR